MIISPATIEKLMASFIKFNFSLIRFLSKPVAVLMLEKNKESLKLASIIEANCDVDETIQQWIKVVRQEK